MIRVLTHCYTLLLATACSALPPEGPGGRESSEAEGSAVTSSEMPCFTNETYRYELERQDLDPSDTTMEWLEEAADANHALAAHELGLMFVRGDGVPADYEKAYSYFEKAARLGIHTSMQSLGIMWKRGEGRPIDLSRAYAWYRLAGDYVPTDWDEWFMPRTKVRMFKTMAAELAKTMTPEAISEGDEYYAAVSREIQCDFYSWLRSTAQARAESQ